MRDFINKLRETRQQAGEERRQLAEEAQQTRQQEQDRQRVVDEAAKRIERYVSDRLHDFQAEFVEFLYDASSDRGRQLRVHWNEPPSGNVKRAVFHQLAFIVRRHHDYADVEVDVKAVIGNSELPFRRREEDVFEGDFEKLEQFIDEQIIGYTQKYVQQRNW